MAYKNNVSVRVCGKMMTLTGNESVEYITKVANYIEAKADEVRTSDNSRSLNPNLVSVLTSINVADDYFKELEKCEKLSKEIDTLNANKNSTGNMEIIMSDETKSEYETKIATLTKENEEARLKEKNLLTELEATKAERDDFKKQLEKMNETVKALKETVPREQVELVELEAIKRERDELKEQIENIKEKSIKLEDEISKKQVTSAELEMIKAERDRFAKQTNELNEKNAALEEDLKRKIAKINHIKSNEHKLSLQKAKVEKELSEEIIEVQEAIIREPHKIQPNS